MAEHNQRLISYVEEIIKLNHSSAATLVVLKDNDIILAHYAGYHSNSVGSTPITDTSEFNVAFAMKKLFRIVGSF